MTPVMTPKEIDVFEAFLRVSRHYTEFGAGGSTFLATRLVRDSVTSVDSSRDWLDRVENTCAEAGHPIQPTLVFADIGPTGEWGAPQGGQFRDRWPRYYTDVWALSGRRNSDLYLIDGRFRVACFMSVLKNCLPDSIIMIHDFDSRERYHRIKTAARQIAGVDDLAIFMPDPHVEQACIDAILSEYRYDSL